MDFLELKTSVQQMLSADLSANIGDYVNWAVDDFNSRVRWPHLEITSGALAVTSTQEAYALTGASPVVPGFSGMIDVQIKVGTSKWKAAYAAPQEYDFFAGRPSSGVPSIYTVIGSGGVESLLLYPTPDATSGLTYILRFYGLSVSALSGDTDKPNVPVQYHQAIMFLAAATGLMFLDQEQEAQVAQQKAEGIIAKAMATSISDRGGDSTTLMLQNRTPRAPGDPRDQNPAGGSAQSD